MKSATFKITLSAILSAAAIISFLIENLFPPIFIPGARLGLSNVFVLLAAICLGSVYGFAVLTVKCLLGSLLSGNFSAIIYSLPAGLLSLTLQILLLYGIKNVSVIAVSVAGGTINLALQNTAFCIIAGGSEYFTYLPYLALIGALSGAFVGFTVYITIKLIPEKYLLKNDFDKENEN